MPRARANIRAKFIAQMETSKAWAATTRAPAEATRPTMVSRSGRPAATRAPKARTRMASVTGQLSNSERIMAVRLAALKSLHMPEAPVRLTLTAPVPARRSGPFRLSAARTMPVGSFAAPAVTMAVWASRLIEAPGRGGVTVRTASLPARIAPARAIVARKAGSRVVSVGECTTTMSAELEFPANARSIRARACTDCEPESCQPAPERAVSTRGARTPSPSATTTQAIATSRTWVADQRPRRPTGPRALIRPPPAGR